MCLDSRLILFYLFVYYNTTGMLCPKTVNKTRHLNVLNFLLWFSQVHKSNLLLSSLSTLTTMTWQESERSEQPASITNVLRFFSACRLWFSLMAIHARFVEQFFFLVFQVYPINSFIHSLVFSLIGRAGRNQSPVMWPVWLWHTASWASTWG